MSSATVSLGCAASAAPALGREFRSSLVSDVTPIVFVLDEDVSVRKSLERLIGREGWRCRTFASAQEFLRSSPAIAPNCLVLDVSLPGLSGLDLQKRMAIERPHMPVIFITDRGDIPTAVQAMLAGAVDFFPR